jgi:hypothetical protein
MKIPFFSLFGVGAGLLAIAPFSLHAEPALAGNSHLEAQPLDAEAIKAILLGKRVTLGATRIVIVIARTGAAQEEFLQSHVGMTTSQFQNHWRRLFMTGGGSAPKIVETEADACKLAAETPGAILIADTANTGGLVLFVSK